MMPVWATRWKTCLALQKIIFPCPMRQNGNSSRAFKFVPSILLPDFGWSHSRAGDKYPATEKSFRQTIHACAYSSRGFRIVVDRKARKVLMVFDADHIDTKLHAAWKHTCPKKLCPYPYWGFDDLFHKAATKLHHCFLVKAASKIEQGMLYFHYQDIYVLKGFHQDKWLDAIEKGQVYVDVDARSGHNHGTKFRIRRDQLIDLYAEVKQY